MILRKLIQFVSKLLIVVGVFMMALGAYGIYDSKQQVNQTLRELQNMQSASDSLLEGEASNNNSQEDGLEINEELDQEADEEKESINRGKIISEITEGDVIAELVVANTSIAVLTGKNEKLLKQGALHYGGTPYPSEDGNSIIIGHRDGVFNVLQKVSLGDKIELNTVYGAYKLEVVEIKIMDPMDASIFDSYGYPTVSLETCYPFFILWSIS